MLGELAQATVTALSLGSMYALVAIGVTLIFATTGILNFAQGEFVMLGGMVMVMLHGDWGWPVYLAVPIAIVATMAVAGLLMLVSFRRRGRSLLAALIVTIGASLVISGTAFQLWGGDVHRFAPFSGEAPLHVAGAAVPPQSLWIVGATAAIFLALTLFFRRSLYGKAMRACAIDPGAAAMLGINVPLMILLGFAISGALGAAAGILLTPLTMIDSSAGLGLAIKGFAAAMFGGMGNIAGAVLGGFLIAALESYASVLISTSLKELVAFLVIILILLFMPRGLLGSSHREAFGEQESLGL
jgi:branched-chain amino acid transport system permease protein